PLPANGAPSTPPDAHTIALRRAPPRQPPVAETPPLPPLPAESVGTTTIPVRRGVPQRPVPNEVLEPPLEDAADEFSAPILLDSPAAPPAPSPESVPAEASCPRCGSRLISPESLGLCQTCGYCRSLQESGARIRVASQQPGSQQRPSLVQFFESLGRLPE